MDPVVIVLYVSHSITVRNAALFIKSIRRFGGYMKNTPILVMNDQAAKLDLSLLDLTGVTVYDIEINPVHRHFLFSKKVHACATAERLLEGKAEMLLYFDTEMLAFSDFSPILLKKDFDASLRPVMLLNTVGQSPDKALDGYWKRIYQESGIDESTVPVLRAYVDEQDMRFYINCEVMAIRPELGILREWRKAFLKIIDDKAFTESFCSEQLHYIFLHQAVLSAVILSKTEPSRIQWIPDSTVYSVLLHEQMPKHKKVSDADAIPIIGYDLQFSGDPAMILTFTVNEPHRTWVIDNYCGFLQESPKIYREEGDCNTVVVLTEKGYILVDPSRPQGMDSWLALKFRHMTPEAVLFTHAHQDHWNGLAYWNIPEKTPMIIQRNWMETVEYLERFEAFQERRNRAFTAGKWMPQKQLKMITPTEVFPDETSMTLSGLEVRMLHTPAETTDTSVIWFPGLKLACTGDTVSSGFPMLGTPRGSMPRFADNYIRAIDILLSLNLELCIAGHGEPIRENTAITSCLKNRRDAVEYVNNAVIRGINNGISVHELVSEISLPMELQLPETFSRIAWSVRGLYQNYTGWYDGNITSLLDTPISSVFTDIVKTWGAGTLITLAEEKLSENDAQSALHITDLLLRAAPHDQRISEIRRRACEILFKGCRNWGESNLIKDELLRY